MAKAKQAPTTLEPLDIPVSPEAAAVLEMKAGEYLNLLEKDEARVAEVKATMDAHLAELTRIGDALMAYAESQRETLRPDERSITLPLSAGKLAWFKSKRVVVTGVVDTIIRSLKRRGLSRLVRRGKESLNKEAIGENPNLIRGTRGLDLQSYELFSVRPTARTSWLEYDPIDKAWSVKRNDKKKAPTPIAQAAE